MKPSATRAATASVLAEIDAAVRPVERARTAAAVDRVLASAAPAHGGLTSAAAAQVHEWAGLPEHHTMCVHDCAETDEHFDAVVSMRPHNATPGLTRLGPGREALSRLLEDQREDYAPHNVSPHLFPCD